MPDSPTHPRTVLVIEPDPTLADLLEILLRVGGYHIETARTAEEAVAVAQEVQPDLITLDLALPDTDGHYVLESLRDDANLADVPVIVIGSCFYRPSPGDPVVGVLTVPIDAKELDRLVQAAFSGAWRTDREAGLVAAAA